MHHQGGILNRGGHIGCRTNSSAVDREVIRKRFLGKTVTNTQYVSENAWSTWALEVRD